MWRRTKHGHIQYSHFQESMTQAHLPKLKKEPLQHSPAMSDMNDNSVTSMIIQHHQSQSMQRQNADYIQGNIIITIGDCFANFHLSPSAPNGYARRRRTPSLWSGWEIWSWWKILIDVPLICLLSVLLIRPAEGSWGQFVCQRRYLQSLSIGRPLYNHEKEFSWIIINDNSLQSSPINHHQLPVSSIGCTAWWWRNTSSLAASAWCWGQIETCSEGPWVKGGKLQTLCPSCLLLSK